MSAVLTLPQFSNESFPMRDDTPATVTPKSGYHHGDLRAQLIAVVRDLVETHGPDGFSVAEAARRAGVSSAAPYKHFRDRHDILRGVVAAALVDLHQAMRRAAAAHEAGSIAEVAAIGAAYVDFARAAPGVFRLVFGLTEGHDTDPELMAKGEQCFGVVVRSTAFNLGLPETAPDVQRRAYMLWSFVHGHAFLSIDLKHKVDELGTSDHDYLVAVARAVLGRPARA